MLKTKVCQICGEMNNIHSLQYLDIIKKKRVKKDICSNCTKELANDNIDTIAKLWEVNKTVARNQLKLT